MQTIVSINAFTSHEEDRRTRSKRRDFLKHGYNQVFNQSNS